MRTPTGIQQLPGVKHLTLLRAVLWGWVVQPEALGLVVPEQSLKLVMVGLRASGVVSYDACGKPGNQS